MHSYALLGAATILSAASVARAADDSYKVNAICTCDQMMRYYGTKHDGLFGGSWWESGLFLGTLAEVHQMDPDYQGNYMGTYAHTHSEAPKFYNYAGFLNNFYDDEGWWGNGWVAVYDLTHDSTYLDTAISIYNDMSKGKTSCGGITQTKDGSYIASIANELYIYLAASLANRVSSDDKQSYLDEAASVWDWFFNVGVVGDDWLVVDGVDQDSCKPTGNKYSYNQGVIMSAASELFAATQNHTYLYLAEHIANATTAKGSTFTDDNGVITDCQGSCDDQGATFKGPLFKGISMLQLHNGHSNWVDWLATNAKSLWNHALDVEDGKCNTGYDFSGPMSTVSECTQGAALMALVAAWRWA